VFLTPHNAWPDTEKVAVAWLTQQMDDVADLTVCTETGPLITPPTIRVQRVPGGGGIQDGIEDLSLLDVECFGGNRDQMWAIARRANAEMINLKWQTVAGSTIDEVVNINGLGEVEYNDPLIRRAIATYELTARVQATV